MFLSRPLVTTAPLVPAGLAASHKVDVADPRFAQLYTADEFALDPTDPRFKARLQQIPHQRGTIMSA